MFQAPGYESDRLSAAVARILGANLLCSMATRGESGMPHMNTAFFCFSPDLILYFLSLPDSLHSHNLRHVPHMAVGVFDSRQHWGDPLAGLQFLGTGAPAGLPAVREAQELYGARFPRYREQVAGSWSGHARHSLLQRLQFYGFRPDRVHILDECEFGEDVFISARIVR
jgi:hypothetical protein